MNDYDWRDDAACTQVDPEIFFADTATNWKQTEAALKVCSGCTVQKACLQDSSADDRWSVRGNMTAVQRRKLRTTRDAA